MSLRYNGRNIVGWVLILFIANAHPSLQGNFLPIQDDSTKIRQIADLTASICASNLSYLHPGVSAEGEAKAN